jgi:predicted DNA-binding transcriptional regulator YafY
VFWASDASKDYIMTKPIHESQTSIKGETENNLHEKHPQFEGGAFFSIDCIPNYELIRELCSFGKDLIVLEPSSIQNQVFNRISMMVEDYLKVRT